MPDALLDEDLLGDALVGVVDDIRRDVHKALGTRQWKVDVITRRWSGDERGAGTPSYAVLELDPTPQVKLNVRDRLGPAGREAAGSIVLSEVSLSYTEAELQPKVDDKTEVAYRITEQQGQRTHVRWGVLSADPLPRRGDKPGDRSDWYLVLNESTPMGDFDGVDNP